MKKIEKTKSDKNDVIFYLFSLLQGKKRSHQAFYISSRSTEIYLNAFEYIRIEMAKWLMVRMYNTMQLSLVHNQL